MTTRRSDLTSITKNEQWKTGVPPVEHRPLPGRAGGPSSIDLTEERESLGHVFFLLVGRFLGVFRGFAGLRKIRIRGFQHRILVAMSKLALHRGIAGRGLGLVLFYGPFAAILIIGERRNQIVFDVSHEVSSVQAGRRISPVHQTIAKLLPVGRVNPVN